MFQNQRIFNKDGTAYTVDKVLLSRSSGEMQMMMLNNLDEEDRKLSIKHIEKIKTTTRFAKSSNEEVKNKDWKRNNQIRKRI